MKNISATADIGIADNDIVTISIKFASADVESIRATFKNKEVVEEKSVYGISVVPVPINVENSDGKERDLVLLSAMLTLQAASNTAAPRLSDIRFLGECENCGDIVDITNNLTREQKGDILRNFGYEVKDNGDAVCRHYTPLPCCPACAKSSSV